ncbi:MAG TPA: SCO family protein [Polyangiaceae bacterium]
MKRRAIPLVLAVAAALGCSRRDAPVGTEPSASASARPLPSVLPGDSIYVLGTHLVDQDGTGVSLDVFRGHPVLIAMFYGSCPAACPTLTRDLKSIEGRLTTEERADVRVLMISFDPERDTPSALKALAVKHGVDTARWKFATSTESGVREISAVLGVQYRKMDDGEYSHSTKIVLLDRDGAMVTSLEGLRQPADDLLAKLRGLSSR